jgi:RNA polymerase sigma-70 factor (ECF subfamily)
MTRSEPAQKVRPTRTGERLLIEAAQRDRARFADIYEEYFELVYAYVARRVRDRSTAEDLASEVFHKALANLPKFKWTGAPFASWLFRIASNLIADRAKRAAKTSATSEEIELTPQDSRKDSQSGLEDVERQAQLFRLVDGLPDDQKRVVGLRFAEDKSIKQVAAELGRSEGAVKQLQFRALENLRKKFATDRPGNTRAEK